ncbi:nuclear transport factor 2 family protein [Microbacterium sp. AGC85]
MPWIPELFAAKYLAKMRLERNAGAVPYFEGLLSEDVDALVNSFVGEPELHHPIHGRIKGDDVFRRYVARVSDELRQANYSVSPIDLIVTPTRTVEEVILSTDSPEGRIDLPIAIVTDREPSGLVEIRMYFSTWPLTGEHAIRPPLLQEDPDVHESGAVGEYQRALAAGDLAATLAAFEPEATVREPAGGAYTHTGTNALTDLYTLFFSNGGGIPLEHCTATDDGRACALEYNVTQWGRTAMPPEAGVAIYVRATSGKIVAARIYDDSNPPLH